jgi:enamine deaminase RidA (YjgF/YER057c/UK114 family)
MPIKQRLQELAIELKVPAAPVANYIGYNSIGDIVYISGQICMEDGKLKYAGKLGKDYDVAAGQKAARLCAINLLSQLNSACQGDLGRVKQVIMLNIFINSTDDFKEQAQVANGASDLIAAIFGAKGKHARAAVSCNSLPLGTAVEISAMVQIDKD